MSGLLIILHDVASAFFTLLTYGIIIRSVLSWFQPDPYHPLVRMLIRFTDPILLPIQRFMPNLGGLDLSPIVAIFLVQGAQSMVGGILASLAQSLG